MSQLELLPVRPPLGVNLHAEDIAAYRAARVRAVAAGWRWRRDIMGVTWSRPWAGGVVEVHQHDVTVLGIQYLWPTTNRLGPSRAGWMDTVSVRSIRQAVAVLDALGLLDGPEPIGAQE